MPITTPVQVGGELASAAYANQVRSDLIDLDEERRDLGPHWLRFVPGGNIDGGAGAWGDWLDEYLAQLLDTTERRRSR